MGFKPTIIAYDPYISASRFPEVELVSLDELCARADIIVSCAALTETSRGIINAEMLAKTKPGVLIVNVSRGGIVVEQALRDALESGHVAYAALDVRSPEPPDPSNDLLTSHPNVTLTQHIAAARWSRSRASTSRRRSRSSSCSVSRAGCPRLPRRSARGRWPATRAPSWSARSARGTTAEQLDEAMFRLADPDASPSPGFATSTCSGRPARDTPSTARGSGSVIEVFGDETAKHGITPMVGVIGLSTANVLERLRIAYDLGIP